MVQGVLVKVAGDEHLESVQSDQCVSIVVGCFQPVLIF